MDILGRIYNSKKEFIVDNKKININNLFVFIKGKIFNLESLCKKYKIISNDQTKVVEELYQKLGTDFIKELDGDFAIIIYDSNIDKLYLIKDKLGSVFIYYYYDNDQIIFSTSLKLIMNHKNFKKKISKQVLANYLGYMYIYEPYTIFEDTYKLEKGTILTYENKKIKKNNYFNLYTEYKKIKKEKNIDDPKLIKDFTKLFNDSIKKRGNEKSQVGVFMSSGEDSTLLAKLASKNFDKKVNTYTLGFENERDESKNAKIIANYIGTKHHSIILKDKDVIKTIKKVPLIYEEPFADPSIIPNIYLTENIKEKNDFYLTGEGNDAIFINASMYNIYNFYPRIKVFIKKIINILNKKRVYHNFSEMAQVNVVNRFNYSDKIVGKKGKVYHLKRLKEPRRSTVIGDLNNTVSEKYKVKTSSLARYHNYDYYTPFYEVNILLKTFAIPSKKIYHNNHGKYIFRKILHKNIPKKYYENYKKNGFGIPIVDWMQRMMLPEIKTLSKQDFIDKQNLFNYQELINLMNKFEKEPDYNKAVVLWCYYVFQLWYLENINTK